MKKWMLPFFGGLLAVSPLIAQNVSSEIARPKLVVGLMVDQMRWDFLYRYYGRYGENGIKRLLKDGFACEQTFIPYAQTVTASGHASVYTGSVPAINGIMGNEWHDRALGRTVYCVEDPRVKTIGGSPISPPMSPRNLWTSSITDELRLATNFKSKVIGIAIKDRGGILPAGHSANAAYWYDGLSGNWVSSTYYMESLPAWVQAFNGRKIPDSLYRLGWNTLYPVNTYAQSDLDDVPYEGKFQFEQKPVFPRDLSPLIGKNYGQLSATPHGSTLTLQFAKTAVVAEEMGRDAVTDFLAVSLSSPDYTGHQFGPNSIEIEDTYLRLDRELGAFFDFLDKQVGKGQYLFFITADHAVAQVPGYLNDKKIPAGSLSFPIAAMDQALQKKFGYRKLVEATGNYQLYLNYRLIDSAGLDRYLVQNFLLDYLNKDSSILTAFANTSIASANLPAQVRERFQQGYNAKLAGDIQVVLKPAYFYGIRTGTTHGSWYPYDSHIPLVWMGWGIRPGKLYRETYMTDIAATLAALLKVQMPNGCIGTVIHEAIK
ncbi:MAG: alkaline phosphatase family protein [Chitinophagaceae bacterium]|jgi:predicted AlkP superfamily pyrophosphatase or phosphodiesterase|nr:alkaline phosphatase family protein [Chitinophagaceae bacterium]